MHPLPILIAILVSAALAVALLHLLERRLTLSRAKHRSLAGHARWSRRLAALIPYYEYAEPEYFRVDGASEELGRQRQAAFQRLARHFDERCQRSAALTAELRERLADLQFTARYRVPFQFSRHARQSFACGSVLSSSEGPLVIDADGNRRYDLSGSYGVNLFGYEFYKGCIERGSARVRELGPVLGALHPIVAYNVRRLTEISGLDAVSFHMSGTEAVMQAVRLARYHTRRSHIVRFCGAYHGWWGDVQPGIGNPSTAHETYTLKDMDPGALRVLRTRRDIACVLVNPLQALHPNRNAPADSALLDSGRSAHFDRQAYARWLTQLRAVCTARNIVLIFDEVFLGFRIAPGGAQEYFGVRADMVTYGKTLGGGLPVGVLCGRHALMQRYREDRPADVCFARGTFNAHPYVMGAMYEFLQALQTPQIQGLYSELDARWNSRARALNARLHAAGVPVQVRNLSSIWTVCYLRAACYNWMLQYYLHAHGLALSWVGTGRLIFSLDYTDGDFNEVAIRFEAAAVAMLRDGWWQTPRTLDNRSIRRRVLKEMLRVYGRRAAGRSAPRATDAAGLCNKV